MSGLLMNKYGYRRWEDVEKELEDSYHMLALSKDDDAIDVAKAFESHGTECGMVCLAAYLHMDAWQPERTAKRAVNMYIDIVKEDGNWPGSDSFRGMIEWTAWMSTGPLDLAWPLAPKEWPKDLDKRAGLANVMLRMSAPHLKFGNTQMLAGRSIMKFLVDGMKKSKASRV